jgi:hypothetical protein
MDAELTPIRRRAAELASRPGVVADVLSQGAEKASRVAQGTMREVKERMGFQ